MANNRELRILASEIIPCDEKIKYFSVDFPEKWAENLKYIYKIIKCRDKITLPINSLNEALEALPLGIIETNQIYYNDKKYYKPWIMAMEKIDSEIILKVIKSWCTIEFISKKEIEEELVEKISEIMNNFKSSDIICEEKNIDLSKSVAYENGTANPNVYIYSVLGNYIAHIISKSKEVITIGDEVINFIRYKNELISVPIKEYKNSYFSVNISFRVKTIAGYSKPILLIDTGIKRWSNGKFARSIGWKNKTSIFIKYNDSIDNIKCENIVLGRDGMKYDFKDKCYKWSDEVKEILEDATLAYLPNLDEVIEKSEQYIENNEKYTLFIAYNNENNSKFNHPVKKGMSMNEKYEVYKQITEKFEFLHPIAENKYTTVKNSYSGSDLKNKQSIVKYLDEISLKEKELTIEIIYINKNTPNIIAKELIDNIGKSEYISKFNEKGEISINYNGLILNIKSLLAGNIIEPMKDFKTRVNEVVKFLPKTKGKTVTIVEIYDKNYYKNNDPKFAIRKGLYQADRLNQFISNANIELLQEKNLKKLKIAQTKVKTVVCNVLMEVFRQLGIMNSEITLKRLKKLPDNLDLEIIGFNLLSTNYNKYKDTLSFPVAVSIKTGEKNIYVKTPINDWMEYSKAILHLGKNNGNQKKYDEDEINKFFRSILNDANESESMVLVDTSNRLNSILKDFQDKNIIINKSYREFENIRILRVKSNSDIPTCVGINTGAEAYFFSGLKKVTENVFYSSEGKTTTYKGVRNKHTKLSNLNKEFKTPSVLEIVPIKLNSEDYVESFVYFVHMLRQLNITHHEFSSVPMVNHLAKSFQEVLLVKDVDETDE